VPEGCLPRDEQVVPARTLHDLGCLFFELAGLPLAKLTLY
jgi:hypothetical protein